MRDSVLVTRAWWPAALFIVVSCAAAPCVVQPLPIPRIHIQNLTPELWHEYDGRKPLMITGMMDNWPVSKWTAKYLKRAVGKSKIHSMWQQPYKEGSGADMWIQGLETTLNELLAEAADSTPEDTVMTIDENFVYRNRVVNKEFVLPKLFETDYFRTPGWFHNAEGEVKLIRPTNRALCIGGHGALSDLHVDLYNWTGWNALMSGEKMWRFIPPEVDADSMYFWRKANNHNLSAGYNSMGNLYHHHNEKEGCYYASEKYDKLNQQTIYEVTQMPGEIITIPSGWWHQTFHKGVTVGLASQYINGNNVERMLESLIDWNHVEKSCLGTDFDAVPIMERSRRVMECIIETSKAEKDFWYKQKASTHCEGPFSYLDSNGIYRCKRKDREL